MNYNTSKYFSRIMWIIYILIAFTGINFVTKKQNQTPVIEETYTPNDRTINFEVFDGEDISTEEDINNDTRSYIYKVEVFEDLTLSQFDRISNDIIRDIKYDLDKSGENIDLNTLQIDFYKGQDEVYSYIFEE